MDRNRNIGADLHIGKNGDAKLNQRIFPVAQYEKRFSSVIRNELQADVLIVFAAKNTLPAGLHPSIDRQLQQLRNRNIFAGESKQVEVFPTMGLLPIFHIIAAGLGDPGQLHHWREAAALAVKQAAKRKAETVAVAYDPQIIGLSGLSLGDIVYGVTEGLLLGSYRRKTYRHSSSENEDVPIRELVHLFPADTEEPEKPEEGAWSPAIAEAERGMKLAEIYAAATNYARDLTNLPGNMLTPAKLADEAMLLAERFGLECLVLDERQIADRGMGGLYAVGQGSSNPPRMIALKYRGREQSADVLGLVGKGITFDTGGISLKKADGMEEMVSDMGGAAVVLAALYAVARLRLPVNIVAVIPSAENMPSGSALKPGDIISTYSGKTVEVLNTDAEGRLVLADGITYAKELGADRLIDVATLTGAVLVALGDVATGAVTNDETFLKQLQEASSRVGEKLWQLPSYPEYREMLKSEVADVKNSTSPDRWAGCITGGLFVGAFAEDMPWIHLDIGGTAWLWQEKPLDPKGGSGAMVRSIVELVRRLAMTE